MSQTKPLAAVAATAGAFVAGGVSARLLDGRKQRRRLQLRDHDAPFGSVHSQPLTVVATDGVALRAEIDARPGSGDTGPGGAGDGPTIVFLHGWMLNMNEWHYQRLALRGHARLMFLDHRGHGASARPDASSCTLAQLATDVRTAIDQLVPTGPIILVGHSMGAMTIMAMAAQYPELFDERVSATVLCSTSAGNVMHRALPLLPLQMLVRAFTPVLDRGRRFNSYSVIKRWGLGSAALPLHVDMTDEMMMGTSSRTIADFYPNFVDLNLYEALPVLDAISTSIIVGTEDHVTPMRHARALAEAMGSAELIVAEGSGHMVVFERHELVTGVIERLLEHAPDKKRDRIRGQPQ